MRTYLLFMVAVLLVAPGCGRRANEGAAEGAAGEKLMVHSVDKLSLRQGEEKKFSVAVQRVKLEGPVQLAFADLPKGTHIEPTDTTVPADKNEIFLTLKIDADAPPVKETSIKVTAALGKLQATSTLKLEVSEGLENKAAHKDAFVKEMKTRLDAINKQLDEGSEKNKTLKDDTKANFEKEHSKLSKTYANTKKSFDSLVATPVENWDRTRSEVSNAVGNLEKAVATYQKSLDKALMK